MSLLQPIACSFSGNALKRCGTCGLVTSDPAGACVRKRADLPGGPYSTGRGFGFFAQWKSLPLLALRRSGKKPFVVSIVDELLVLLEVTKKLGGQLLPHPSWS